MMIRKQPNKMAFFLNNKAIEAIKKSRSFFIFGIIFISIIVFSNTLYAQNTAPQNEELSESQFLQTLNDIPLMPDLYELTDHAVLFDKAQGRIARSEAITKKHSALEIYKFYNQTLPQMGWTMTKKGHFTRENEVLQIDIKKTNNQSIVYFMLSPR